MTTPHVALIGFCAGASIACGWMAACIARTVYTITRDHRWADVVRLTDIGANRVH